jgi:FixJ family two-component response regulator
MRPAASTSWCGSPSTSSINFTGIIRQFPGRRKAGHTVIPMTDIVYVVDDDASVCNAVRRLLKSAQYRVRTFASAEEFRQADFKSSPGCLLLDIKLPGINGFELQEELLVSGVRMPVIFVTGHDRAGMEERAMRLGATAYLRKPFDEEALLGAISMAMKSLFNGKTDEKEKNRTG